MFVVVLAAAMALTSAGKHSSLSPLDAFNRAFAEANLHMDNAAVLALWEEDGIALLPRSEPLIGRTRIARMLDGVTSKHPGAHMDSFTFQCHDAKVVGDWATEWCVEHQLVSGLGTKTFDGWGKMLLVLHRGRDGRWRLSREMRNQATPAAAPASQQQ
jgi:ketosteroid isomerase-like protein